MKKAVVVGGSNGIGLAITRKLIEKNLYVHIVDASEPDPAHLPTSGFEWHFCDLLHYDEALFANLANDADVEFLMITAGFGRVTEFQSLASFEIKNLMEVNASAGIRIVRSFYHRIRSAEPFFCGMMGSIAGLVSSPLFSVYAASKAAICRFIESVNIELEMSSTGNRILNVSPGSISGTRFNGSENDLSLTDSLADQIISQLYAHSELFIPQYDEIYRGVLDRYQANPHEYGVHSYEYKMNSGRVNKGRKPVVGYLSGTFDLFHIGHLNLIRRAKKLCDYLIVGVHPTAAHKGKQTFISFEERMEIVGACRYVDRVVESCLEDSDAWNLHHFDRLFVGSDYKGTERFLRYEEFFSDKGVEIVYFPYTQTTSSTQIRQTISDKL